MKLIRLIVTCVIAVMLAPACARTPQQTEVVNGVVDCAVAELQIVANELGPLVSAILAGAEWKSGLTELGKRHGEAAVSCAVAVIAGAVGVRGDEALVKQERGRSWLASRPYRVTGTP